MHHNDSNKKKIIFLFFIVTLGFLLFLGASFYWATVDRKLPSLTRKEVNHALRGDIVSSDGFRIATSQKLYKVTLDTRNLDPDKKELFINLYSLYSGDNPKKVLKIINSNFGHVVLSYKIDSKKAKYLKELARKLFSLRVFVSYENPKTKTSFLHGMNIIESGEKRLYPAVDILTPVIGYVRKIEKDGITKVTGVKGLEKYYEDNLIAIQDSILFGNRDISGVIIRDRNSRYQQAIDGFNIRLNISLKIQKIIEKILDRNKDELQAKEIIAGVMDSKNGYVLALASSNRYNPDFIKRKDYASLNVTATEYAYEPGSVMKSITFALLLKENKINPYDLIRIFGGRYKLGKNIIRDSHKYEWLSAEDIIVHSSNVGIAQIAQNLDNFQFYQGLKDFGFSLRSGIDLPYEARGEIPPLYKFKSEVYKASVGYGYGMRATFMQILKAYNVFNNNGKMLIPKIAKSYFSPETGEVDFEKPPFKQVIPVSVAKRMKKILIKTVQKGTGKAAVFEGLEIGGKTGTAKIASHGGYSKVYNSSFFGFANDKKQRFTIGVLVREPKKKYYYYASLTAVPVFKEIVDALVEEGLLNPTLY